MAQTTKATQPKVDIKSILTNPDIDLNKYLQGLPTDVLKEIIVKLKTEINLNKTAKETYKAMAEETLTNKEKEIENVKQTYSNLLRDLCKKLAIVDKFNELEQLVLNIFKGDTK